MDHRRELSAILEDMSATESEMERYRDRLAKHLSSPRKSFAMRWLRVWIPLAATALLFWFLLAPPRSFGPESLDGLRTWVETQHDSAVLLDKADELSRTGRGTVRLNAMMVQCLLNTGEDAMQVAAEALTEEKRPEFRALYLEVLLDHADEYAFNPEFVEQLIDREHDPVCLRLMKELLTVS